MSSLGDVLVVGGIVLFAIVVTVGMWRSRTSGRRQQAVAGSLRDIDDADGSRRLVASLSPNGDVVIEGCDYGSGVERVFGYREYEWAWTIPAAEVPALLRALDATDAVISAIGRRFSGDAAAELGEFLDANGIRTERWSRIGD